MTHVVLENCIRCKYTDCVEVCPVNCFYEGETVLAIHPDECIDCGVCVPERPAEAIVPDSETFDPIRLDITQKKTPRGGADGLNGTPDKYEQYFSPEPGEGD